VAANESQIELMTDPAKPSARMGVYTDSWTSMDLKPEGQVRNRLIQPYQVNAELMSLAAPDAVFMQLPSGAPRAWNHPGNPRRPQSSSSINPKTACTFRRPSCILCSDPSMLFIESHRISL